MSQIQWYPGHMNKAKNQLAGSLRLIDVVLEVRDARLPESSANPMLDDLLAGKPHVILLNKADLADPQLTAAWLKRLGPNALALDTQHNTNVSQLVKKIKAAAADLDKKLVRVAVVGIPNCGKSTVINKLSGKKRTVTGNKPGVTQQLLWLKTSFGIQILDTPGILWPKFDDQQVGLKLAACGAIKDTVFASDDVALFVLDFLCQHYAKQLAKFARVEISEDESSPDLLLAMTAKYGMRDDYERFSLFMLQQLRKGKLGRITLDRP